MHKTERSPLKSFSALTSGICFTNSLCPYLSFHLTNCGPYEVTIITSRQLWKHPRFLFGETYFCYWFLSKYSKELFDYGVDIRRRKEDFLNIKRYVPCGLSYIRECQRSYTRQFRKACCNSTMIFVISSKKGNHFWSRFFLRVATFGIC